MHAKLDDFSLHAIAIRQAICCLTSRRSGHHYCFIDRWTLFDSRRNFFRALVGGGVFIVNAGIIQGGSNMIGTDAACLHTNQSRSYLNHLVS